MRGFASDSDRARAFGLRALHRRTRVPRAVAVLASVLLVHGGSAALASPPVAGGRYVGLTRGSDGTMVRLDLKLANDGLELDHLSELHVEEACPGTTFIDWVNMDHVLQGFRLPTLPSFRSTPVTREGRFVYRQKVPTPASLIGRFLRGGRRLAIHYFFATSHDLAPCRDLRGRVTRGWSLGRHGCPAGRRRARG
jgi:hypothetical protein